MMELGSTSQELFDEIAALIERAKSKVAVSLNSETTLLYWGMGNFLFRELKKKNQITYGKQILETLSQQLTSRFGKGFTYTSLASVSVLTNRKIEK